MLMTKEFSWGPGGGSANQQTDMQALTFYSDPKIDFDIMVDGTSFPAGAATWFQFWIVGNSDGAAGWTQSQLVDAYQNADQSDLRVWHFSRTFADLGWEPGDTWFQFWTGANSDGAVPVEWYIDNVVVYDTVVPEPSTIALAGLGSLLLLFRRRH
jgi:hypothetical protein